MHNREYLSQLIEQYLLDLQLPGEPTQLYEPIRYSLEGGGKRLRPLVVLMACDLFSGDVHRALPLAAAVEVFHNFTLLHDDIMDNAAVRRGKPAVHARWSINTAILSGDVMMIFSYKLLALSLTDNISPLFDEFNMMAAEVCEGQQYDMDFERQESVGEDQYMEMIALKTAALIARAAKMGAMTAGANGENCLNMYRFGYELGIAFQLQDDLLDSYGDHLSFGKKVGGDIIEGKKSFLAVSAIKHASPKQKKELTAMLTDSTIPDALKIESVRNIYDSLNIRKLTNERIKKHIMLAIDALRRVDVQPERLEPLNRLALGMLDREK